MSAAEASDTVHGLVTRVAAEPRTASKGGYPFRGIEVARTGDSRRIFLICPDFAGQDLFDFPLLCWEGASISAYDIEFNNTLEDGSVIFTAAPDSLLLLEPHIPVSVTEAVEAADCGRSVDLRFRVSPEEPFWMAKGKLIHSMFDQIINSRGGPSGFAEAFRRALPDLTEAMAGSGISTNCALVEKEAEVHYQNLRSWLDENLAMFSSARIEHDRTSRRWGLKGRADALFRSHSGNTILELKTGRVASESHGIQLSAYHFLFSDAEDSESAWGYLLYSATGKTENVERPSRRMQRLILQGRNRVVALKRSYGLPGGPDPAGLDQPFCDPARKCFSRSACFRLFGDGRGRKGLLQGEHKRYYDHWFKLLSVEDWTQEQDFLRILNPETLPRRVTDGTTLAVEAMRIRQPDESETGLGRVFAANRDNHSCADSATADSTAVSTASSERVIARISLSDPNASLGHGEEVIIHSGDPCAKDALRARVVGSADREIIVSFRRPIALSAKQRTCHSEGKPETTAWFLDRIPFSNGPQVARRMLFRFFVKADPEVVRCIVHGEPEDQPGAPGTLANQTKISAGHARGSSKPRPGMRDAVSRPNTTSDSAAELEDLCFSEGLSAELNEDQESAVRSALSCEIYHLVHGPPGTGKTRVLARLIRLCLDRGERVLVVCPTNVALDRLLISTMALGAKDILRVGKRSVASAEFVREIERLGNPPLFLNDFSRHESDFAAFRKTVSGTQLIAATAYQCASHPVFLRQRFDRVIVDEAGQLDEPSTLAPLSLAKRFVIGGDHLQLPPVVQSGKKDNSREAVPGLERSLFERLFLSSPSAKVSSLKVQYRMNAEVQDIPSRLFYGGTLVPSPDVALRRLRINAGSSESREMERIIDPGLPVVFVDVRGGDCGKARPEEADAVAKITGILLACGVSSDEVGIITPYRAQQALIRNRLAQGTNGADRLSVDTVDRFQGGEREVIILSLARSDGVTSFLADRKRLNVSLSRARSKLILLGHGEVLQEHPLFADILDGLERITLVT